MQWLNENDDVSMDYLHGAYQRDKRDGVSRGRGLGQGNKCLISVMVFQWTVLHVL